MRRPLPTRRRSTCLPSPRPRESELTATHRTQSLARSHHTITTIGDKAYIFGGEGPDGNLCSSDVHIIHLPSQAPTSTTKPKHAVQEPFPLEDARTGELLLPEPRTQHAACARGKHIIIHGGLDASGNPIEEDNCLWLYDTWTLQWSKLPSVTQLGKAMPSRYGHSLFYDAAQDFLVLHGGHTTRYIKEHPPSFSILSDPHLPTETETWMYDFPSHSWTALPRAPSAPLSATYVDTTLITIAAGDKLSGTIHHLRLLPNATEREKPGALKWRTVTYPTNPLTPGPRPRSDAVLVPLATGHGRYYLVYMLGRDDAGAYCSDMWTLQLPSHGLTAASAKDKIRDAVMSHGSGAWSWAGVELVPTEQMVPGGKVHPGPRARVAADGCLGGKGVVLWGGENAKGEREGDGWVVGLAYGYADRDRWE